MKSKNKKLIIPIVILLIMAVYCVAIVQMNDRLPGNTYINGKDCSFMKYAEAADVLTQNIPSRKIVIKNGEETEGEIDAKDYAAMSFKEETIEAITKNTSAIDKIFFFLYGFQYNIEPEVIVSSESLNSLVKEFGGTEPPANAYVAKVKDSLSFEIIPETNGNSIDTYTAEEIIAKTIEENLGEADISDAFIKAGVLSNDERLIEKCNKLNYDFADIVIKFIYKDGASAKTTVLKDNELFLMYKTDEYGIPYLNDEKTYEVDSKLAKDYIEKIVPDDYVEAVPVITQNESNQLENKTKETSTQKTRDKKVEELTDWLINMLQQCKSGNKTF